MGSTYQVEIVFVQELGGNFGAERERDAAIVFAPAHRVLQTINKIVRKLRTVITDLKEHHLSVRKN